MPDLIPHHEPRLIDTKDGWTTWDYRGARIRSSGVHNVLRLPGHPYDGKTFGHLDHVVTLVGHWLDHGKLPKPYVWPPKG